ncbi:MAG TPA: FIST N-terminal domain-containing protein [Bacilli bacterium]|nr:FIST N-terminal domain-containing protein [Bacilli bacterium]HPZ24168.1 FIST N-terminal domain-containing protein [Bacilli bacterium]HQC83648.1 FIST N-terminal domain-containing protein [Bacilli bacterium]
MLKSKIGYSILENAYDAGVETAKMATSDIEGKIGFLYSSVVYDQEKLIQGIKSVSPDLKIVGCTTNGAVMVPSGILDNPNGFAALLVFAGEDLVVGTAASDAMDDARKTGRMVAMEALKSAGKNIVPNYFYMSAAPAQEEFFVKGIQDVIGRVPFFGGSGADNDLSGKWSMFNENKVTKDGVTVAFFYTKETIATTYTGAYHETSDMGVITKVNGNRQLMEINNQPALDVYSKWCNYNMEDVMGGKLLVSAITNPLAVKDRLGDLAAIRHPMNGNEDKSMNIGNQLAVGTAVVRMTATVDELIGATKTTLEETKKSLKNPAGYMLIHCGGRKIAIGNRINEVYQNIKSVAGDVPFVVAFTFGEYGYSKDCQVNTCGGLMLSFTGIDE